MRVMADKTAYFAMWDALDAVVVAYLGNEFETPYGPNLRRSMVWDHHIPSVEELLPLARAIHAIDPAGESAEELAARWHRKFSGLDS